MKQSVQGRVGLRVEIPTQHGRALALAARRESQQRISCYPRLQCLNVMALPVLPKPHRE